MYPPILNVHLKKRSVKDLSNDAYVIFLMVLLLIFFIKAYVVGTHLNYIDLTSICCGYSFELH